jgi:hypothetical protein
MYMCTNKQAFQRLDAMRVAGKNVYDSYMSYLRNPKGICDAMLLEAWVQVQRKGLKEGPYFNEKAAKRRKQGMHEDEGVGRGPRRGVGTGGGRRKGANSRGPKP